MNKKNWALFIESDKVQWSFGLQDTTAEDDRFLAEQNEFEKTTVHFIQSLQAIGRELYREGVASIKLENPDNSTLAVNEIFIVNLSDEFFFIISDLEVTTKLINLTSDIPFEIEQLICAVLVGQAAILYSTLIIDEKKFNISIDDVYKSILRQIEVDKRHDLNELVDRGRCSLSPLKMTELLLFHYLLRNFLEQHFLKVSSEAWAIMVDKTGIDIPLSFLPPKDPYLLGNFLGVIYSYVRGLFGVQPSAIVFGGIELIFLQFFGGGKNYFLAASNPTLLVQNETFIELLQKIPKKKLRDVQDSIKQFIIGLTLKDLSNTLNETDFSVLAKIPIENKKLTISTFKLTDIPGLGREAKRKLNKMDIFSIKDLIECDLKFYTEKNSFVAGISEKKLLDWKAKGERLIKKTKVEM